MWKSEKNIADSFVIQSSISNIPKHGQELIIITIVKYTYVGWWKNISIDNAKLLEHNIIYGNIK